MSKKSKDPANSFKSFYALQDQATNNFWDGSNRSRYRTEKTYQPAWVPRFIPQPNSRWTEKTALKFWKSYEIERLCGEKLPILTLVRFEVVPLEVTVKPTIGFTDLVSEKIKRSPEHGYSLAQAFQKVCDTVGHSPEKVKEYRFAFGRKRASTKAFMEENLPQAICYGFMAFVKNETDLIYAKMLLGENFGVHFDMMKFYGDVK